MGLTINGVPVVRWMTEPDYASTPERAAQDGVPVLADGSVVYVRNDGWALGAPAELAGAAYRMWAEDWIAGAVLWRGSWRTWTSRNRGGYLKAWPMAAESRVDDLGSGHMEVS